jgi:hypothetical protein
MIRSILAVVFGFVSWFVFATLGNFLIRALIPGYSAAEPVMTFTLSMMAARLILGAASSLVAGFVCSAIDRGRAATVYACAAILLLFFLSVHYQLWQKFPVWYHLTFLVTLPLLVLLGGAIQRRARTGSAPR